MCKEKYINPFTDFGFKKLFDRDYINTISSAEYMGEKRSIEKGREEGRAEGRAEGIEKGRAEGRTQLQHEIAAKMKANGTPAEQIAAYTGLSLEEISNL